MNSIVIVSHKFNTQPDDDLILYLNDKHVRNVMHITHAFSDSPNRISICSWYKDGELYKMWKSRDFIKYPELFIYIKELIFTIMSLFRSKEAWGLCICMDGLCSLYGLIARSLGRVKKIIYWAIDFVPESRFKSRFRNFVYHSINILSYKKVDEMWDLSPRMAEARERFLGIRIHDYKKHKVVPYGVWVGRIKKYFYEDCEKYTLVFMGHLLEKQGVQLVLKAIPEIIKVIPNFKLKIIGTGKYESTLQKLAYDLRIRDYVTFVGRVEIDEILEEEIAKSCLAVAPYIKSLDTWTYYADPGKVKKYLGCGVPVLLTNVPWNAVEIERNNCGRIISEDTDSIVKNVVDLMDCSINQTLRDNSIKYSKTFDYQTIFDSLLLC